MDWYVKLTGSPKSQAKAKELYGEKYFPRWSSYKFTADTLQAKLTAQGIPSEVGKKGQVKLNYEDVFAMLAMQSIRRK